MTPEEIADHALAKPGAWPDRPFGDERVAKVGPGERGKIFAFLGTGAVGVKCGAGREGPVAKLPRRDRPTPWSDLGH